MSSDETPVSVTLYLAGGIQVRTVLPADSPILRELFEAASRIGDGTSRLMQIPTEGGHGATAFASDRLIAIETSPPVLVEESEEETAAEPPPPKADPVQSRPSAPPEPEHRQLRKPPAVLDAHGAGEAGAAPASTEVDDIFIQVTDFLPPDEFRGLVETTLETRGAPEGSIADRFNERLQLLLAQLHPHPEVVGSLRIGDPRLEVLSDGASAQEEPTDHTLTCRYFFRREDEEISGGAFDLRIGPDLRRVTPKNNAMLVYPSAAFERGRPLECPSSSLADSSFALIWSVGGSDPANA